MKNFFDNFNQKLCYHKNMYTSIFNKVLLISLLLLGNLSGWVGPLNLLIAPIIMIILLLFSIRYQQILFQKTATAELKKWLFMLSPVVLLTMYPSFLLSWSGYTEGNVLHVNPLDFVVTLLIYPIINFLITYLFLKKRYAFYEAMAIYIASQLPISLFGLGYFITLSYGMEGNVFGFIFSTQLFMTLIISLINWILLLKNVWGHRSI